MKRIKNLFIGFLFCLIVCSVCGQSSGDPRIVTFLNAKKGMTINAAYLYAESLFPEWDFKKMRNICLRVSARTLEFDQPVRYKYSYQQKFYEAAHVDTTNDSDDSIAKKISEMWKVYQALGLTVCNASTFDIRDGSILKFAVAEKFDDFLYDAIRWKLDLNRVDFYDQHTLLDYIDLHLTKNKGTPLEPVYQRYFQLFRRAGAKFKREL